MKYKKFIPSFVFNSILDIDLEDLKNKGIKLILSDLDNTLISYAQSMPDDRVFEFKKRLDDLGFEFIIVSNSRKDRVNAFADALGVKCVKFSTKPLKRGIKKAIKTVASKKYQNNEVILIGDQILTDILGANRCKINSGLVLPVDIKTDKRPTRFNRFFEQKILNRIKKKNPEAYKSLKEFDELNDSKEM